MRKCYKLHCREFSQSRQYITDDALLITTGFYNIRRRKQPGDWAILIFFACA